MCQHQSHLVCHLTTSPRHGARWDPADSNSAFVSQYRVGAERAGPGGSKVEENEAIKNGELAAIADRKETTRRVHPEIGKGHFPRESEGHDRREEAEDDENAPGRFEDPGQSGQRTERNPGAMPSHATQPSEDLLDSVRPKSEAGNHAQN